MADTNIKKYLDLVAAEELVKKIKEADAATLASSQKYFDDNKNLFDASGSATTAESNAKAYADTKVGELANGSVADNTAAIAKLNGAATEEGSVAKAVADAKALIDADIDAVEAKADANADAIAFINNETDGILAQAKADATTKANTVQAEVDALETLVGTLPEGTDAETVVAYIDKKTEGIASDAKLTELNDEVTAIDGRVKAIEDDYLVAADKAELEGKITTAQGAAEAAQSHSEGVAADLAEAVEALETADTGLGNRIATLEGQITGLSGAMHFKGVETEIPTDVSSYVAGDVIIVGNKEYVFNNGAFVEFGDVDEEVERLTDLEAKVGTLEGEMNIVQADIEALEGTLSEKVSKTDYDLKMAALDEEDADFEARISAVESAVGETGSLAQDIETAKTEAIESAVATAAEDAATKANAAETNAKTYADGLDAAMNTRVEALEAVDHEHSNKALLDTYTATNADILDAIAKEHEHANKAELDLIVSGDKAKWDAAEQNAKTYADGLNNTLTATVNGISEKVTANENAIALRALDSDLDAAVERITTNETDIAANKAAINSFVAITSAEISALFAAQV